MSDDDDCPFDGVVPVANSKSRVVKPRPKSESVLNQIASTPIESLGFGHFAKLKSGRDSFSELKLPQLQDTISAIERCFVSETFIYDEKSQASCIRWMLRGLDCEKAIRKVKVDLEISSKATSRWKK